MNTCRRLGVIRSASAFCLAALLQTGCVAPVDDRTDDYIEFESVRQYLKAYCIYQDSSIYRGRIPEDPFAYPTPAALFKAVGDTLYGESYTHYTTLSLVNKATPEHAGAMSTAAAATSPTVVLDTLTDSTVHISISEFKYGRTYNEFVDKLRGIASFPFVVIDLRGDGGGDIDDATLIVNTFLPAGTEYLRARERSYDAAAHTARTIPWRPWRTKDVARTELAGKKITILMNRGSASASEILIAALKDCRRPPLFADSVTIVGDTSYGKGIGQIKLVRRDRQPLQITFLQMRGMRIGEYHRIGIKPDIVEPDQSKQLLAAVRVLEPAASQLRRLRKQTIASPTPVAGYRIVYEE